MKAQGRNTLFSRVRTAFNDFFLAPASPRPIAILRICLALILIAQALSLRQTYPDFLSQNGLVQGELANYLTVPFTPRIAWLSHALSPLGVNESMCIQWVCWSYLLSLVLLAFGLATRGASIASWFFHWTLVNSAYSTTYGVDLYAHVFLFYLMWAPAGDAFSLDNLWRRRPVRASQAARLALRVMQLHLCITYFFSGFAKAHGLQWWNGEVLWRAFSLPEYQQFDMSWLIHWPLLLKVAGWSTLALEMGYCVFIWPRLTRRFWIAAMVSMHLGIALFLGLGFFGLTMCFLTLCIFGIPAEPGETLSVFTVSSPAAAAV